MAIVVKTEPGASESVNGDLLYVVHESVKANDPVTYPDYRYLADIYAGAELVTRLKAYPDPVTKMGIFNMGSIFRNYVTPVFNPDLSLFECQYLGDGEWNVSGTVYFGEEYGFTQYPSTIAGVGNTFYGHYNGRLIGQATNLGDIAESFATNRPYQTNMYRGTQNSFIPYYKPSDDVNDIQLVITLFSEDDSILDSTTFNLPAAVVNNLRVFNIGVAGINTEITITDDVAYYTIVSESNAEIRVNLICEPKYTTYTLTFLNKYGGFESRDFTKVSRKLLEIEKKDFGKLPYTVNASGDVSYYNSNNVYNETRSVYASQYKEKMTLNTDILTDAEYTWMADLILSPMVFIEMDSYFIPVIISQNNYEFKKVINDKLTNLTLDIEFGDQFNAQYR